MIPTKEQRAIWRHEFESRSFTSAIDEYCPSAFGDLLDATDILEKQKEHLLPALIKAVTLLCCEYPRDQWPQHGINRMLTAIALAQDCAVDDVLRQIGEE